MSLNNNSIKFSSLKKPNLESKMTIFHKIVKKRQKIFLEILFEKNKQIKPDNLNEFLCEY
jgi:hypothetical protein